MPLWYDVSMIQQHDLAFLLSTQSTSLLIRVNQVGKVVTEYFGARLPEDADWTPAYERYPLTEGRTVNYSEKDPGLSLNWISSDFSTPLKGDYGAPSLLLEEETSDLFDFVYSSFEIRPYAPVEGYPNPHGEAEELVITLLEEAKGAKLELHYVVYEDADVFGRYVRLSNEKGQTFTVKKIMSSQLVLPSRKMNLICYHSQWCNEFEPQKIKIDKAHYSFGTVTGASSDTFNPFFMLEEEGATLAQGKVYGFNLIYSGNHFEEIERNAFGKIRILQGLQPQGLEFKLAKGDSFVTPMAILCVSEHGRNGIAHAMHRFVKAHILPTHWAEKERPIIYNNWEATGAKFDEGKLVSLMKEAKKLGIELFVLDDGWFGKRDDDRSSLGDWKVNPKKIKHGILGLSEKAHKMGLLFGLWFEPEMVNPDSDLYRAHPEWAIQEKDHAPSLGRNQLHLDLTLPEVRDYLLECLVEVIGTGKVDYIKWDYNRTMSDLPRHDGLFFHKYVLGLYDLLARLREHFPTLLMENCASGGARNDLGMFCYFDQCWVSDDTDSYQRTLIQSNMGFGYPQIVMGNHVAAKTSNQLLRKTSYGTKFDIACIGNLGYEFDINDLDPLDRKEIENEIRLYKERRHLFQFGEWDLLETYDDNNVFILEVHDESGAALTYANRLQLPNPEKKRLPLVGMDEKAVYEYEVRPETINLRQFGSLLSMVAPIHIKEDGIIVQILSRHKGIDTEKFSGSISGALLNAGCLSLGQEWSGVGIGDDVRVLTDFGARLYLFKKKES